MSRLSEARTLLADVFEPVLPGRVSPYRLPSLAAGVAPYIWIGDVPLVTRENIGSRAQTRMIVATFPVWIVVDGADRGQLAMLDDVISGVWDAAEVTALCDPRLVQARVNVPEADARLRFATVDVAVTITARTLCTPDVAAATIPPIPVEVG